MGRPIGRRKIDGMHLVKNNSSQATVENPKVRGGKLVETEQAENSPHYKTNSSQSYKQKFRELIGLETNRSRLNGCYFLVT